MTIRPDVVAALAVIDPAKPLTPAELDTIGGATFEEVEAVRNLALSMLEVANDQAADAARLAALVEPYFARLPEGSTLSDVAALMTDAERDEMADLLDRIAPTA